jgi:hypothetical protein
MGKWILAGCGSLFVVFACAAIGIGLWLMGEYNGFQTTEVNLSAAWEDEQNWLSSYVLGFQEQASTMGFNATAIKDIMVAAIDAQPGDDNFGSGALVASITQAYPDAGAAEITRLADRLMTYTESQRSAFRDKHSKTIDMTRVFEIKLNTFPGNLIAGVMSIPDGNLQARVGGQILATGRDALAMIRRPISDAKTNEAFQTGVMQPLSPFSPTAAPTAAR